MGVACVCPCVGGERRDESETREGRESRRIGESEMLKLGGT